MVWFLVTFCCTLAPTLAPPPVAAGLSQDLVDVGRAARSRIERLAPGVAKDGFEPQARELIEIYSALGADPADVQELQAKVANVASGIRKSSKAGRHATACRKLAKDLATQLAKVGEQKRHLAEIILRLDGGIDSAHEVLGHVADGDGGWVSRDQARARDRTLELTEGWQQLWKDHYEFQQVEAPDWVKAGGQEVLGIHAQGFELFAPLPRAELEQRFDHLARLMAGSRYLMKDKLQLRPPNGWHYCTYGDENAFRQVVGYLLANPVDSFLGEESEDRGRSVRLQVVGFDLITDHDSWLEENVIRYFHSEQRPTYLPAWFEVGHAHYLMMSMYSNGRADSYLARLAAEQDGKDVPPLTPAPALEEIHQQVRHDLAAGRFLGVRGLDGYSEPDIRQNPEMLALSTCLAEYLHLSRSARNYVRAYRDAGLAAVRGEAPDHEQLLKSAFRSSVDVFEASFLGWLLPGGASLAGQFDAFH